MITVDQVKQMLTAYGITVPDFVITAAVESANAIEACLVGAGLSPANIVLAQVYAAAIVAGGNDARVVTSQTAPSGASQSYKYGDKGLSALRSTLRQLDKSGCTKSMVGTDPVRASFMRVSG